MKGYVELDLKHRRQRLQSNCAAASLQMALTVFKVRYPQEDLNVLCGTTREGTKLQGLVSAVKKLGLKPASRWRASFPSFSRACESIARYIKQKSPVIMCIRYPSWKDSHYVAVRAVDFSKRVIKFADPARDSTHTVRFPKLREIWWSEDATGAPWLMAIRVRSQAKASRKRSK